MSVVAFFCGLLLIALVLQDAFEVVLLPRRVKRRYRFTTAFFAGSWRTWAFVARLSAPGPARERFLSIFGPLAMLSLFVLWAAGLIIGFGLLQWSIQVVSHAHPVQTLANDLYLSGVTFFTLGYGDITPQGHLAKFAAVGEAGVGFGIIAVVIGYLPVLYQLFSRREAHVLQLDARAGSPPTASVLLRRHAESGALDHLDEVLRTWEIWGADLLESHLSYPMLAYYRSQHDDQSWLAALAAVLDACALVMVGVEGAKPLQARMTFATLRQVVVEMARSLRIGPARGERPLDLEPTVYAGMVETFAEAGLTWKTGEGVEETLAALRATYAPLVHGMAEYLIIPVPGLVPDDNAPDHWDQGPRGLIARRLVEGLTEGTLQVDAAAASARRRRSAVGRLRDRLRDG